MLKSDADRLALVHPKVFAIFVPICNVLKYFYKTLQIMIKANIKEIQRTAIL
jgi:hypothetical protein